VPTQRGSAKAGMPPKRASSSAWTLHCGGNVLYRYQLAPRTPLYMPRPNKPS
jgi:hypothetical protein